LCLRCVRTVGCRDPVYNSAANGIEVGHDTSRMTLHAVFVNIRVNCVNLSFALGKIGKMRLNRKQKKRVAATVMLRLKIVNWVTTADGCVHTADTTQLHFVVVSANLFRLVKTVANCRQLNTHRRRKSTRQLSCVGVGGMYWEFYKHAATQTNRHYQTTETYRERLQLRCPLLSACCVGAKRRRRCHVNIAQLWIVVVLSGGRHPRR